MDNCDKVEDKGYMKRFTPEQLSQMKEELSETAIKINDIEERKKEVMAEFKEKLDPLTKEKQRILTGLKNKAEHVTEQCYKFVDMETREVGYYNQDWGAHREPTRLRRRAAGHHLSDEREPERKSSNSPIITIAF